jgi:hypothetical protein
MIIGVGIFNNSILAAWFEEFWVVGRVEADW